MYSTGNANNGTYIAPSSVLLQFNLPTYVCSLIQSHSRSADAIDGTM